MDMTFKNWLWLFTVAAGSLIFSGCYAHSSHYVTGYDYYEPAYVEPVYVEEVYVEAPVVYYSRGHGSYRHHHRPCY